MKAYLDLCQKVLRDGEERHDRTGVGTKALFAQSMRFDLSNSFPLLTTKKVAFKAAVAELLWFIKGSTNIEELVHQDVRIWNEWPYQAYQKHPDYQGESLAEFVNKIKHDHHFAMKHGDLGPVYGKQWRDFGGVDQLALLEKQLRENPTSRRHLLSAWNVGEIDRMLLPPCHAFVQFYVSNDQKLSCHLYQRSGDVFLGVPFNIASYSLLTCLLAATLDLAPGEFVHTIGDCHIYLNHIDQVKEQMMREVRPLPTIKIRKRSSIFDYVIEDIELCNYDPHPPIKAVVAV